MNAGIVWRIPSEPRRRQRLYVPVYIFFLAFICSHSLVGCAIPKNDGDFKPPAGTGREQFSTDIKECVKWALKFRDTPLSHEEQVLLDGIETARFFSEGGRGRNGSSDHYVLCFIKRGYQWVPSK